MCFLMERLRMPQFSHLECGEVGQEEGGYVTPFALALGFLSVSPVQASHLLLGLFSTLDKLFLFLKLKTHARAVSGLIASPATRCFGVCLSLRPSPPRVS